LIQRVAAPLVAALLLTSAASGCATQGAAVQGGAPLAGGADPAASAPATPAAEAPEDEAAGSRLPQVELETLAGERLALEPLCAPGKVLLLSFWATWCEPCKQELPHLERLHRELGDKGLSVVAVSVDGPSSVAELRSYVRSRRLELTVGLDMDRRLTESLNPKMLMPYWLLVGDGGRILKTHQGYLPGDERGLEAAVRSALRLPVSP